MRPLGEIASGPHGWRGNTFGPLPVAGAKRQTYEPISEESTETAQQVVVATPVPLLRKGEGAEPDAATAAASALLSQARKHDEQRERRLYDPWMGRR